MNEKACSIRMEQAKNNRSAQIARDNVLSFFSKNKDLCLGAYQYYSNYSVNRNAYISEPIEDRCICDSFEKVYLLITVNEIEEGVLLRYLSELNRAPLKCYLINESVYHVCTVTLNNQKYTLIHTRSERTGDEYMRRTINLAAEVIGKNKILYIYLLGICYGIDLQSQKLGDVVISDHVLGYRVNFRDEASTDEIKVEPELEFDEKPNEKHIQKITNFLSYYDVKNNNFNLPQYSVTIYSGKYLSANSLMSSKKAKDSIIAQIGTAKPKAKAGEMEACGIYKSSLSSTTTNYQNWLIIKSICDWGEDKNVYPQNAEQNELIKNSLQAYAMINTCNALNIIITKKLIY